MLKSGVVANNRMNRERGCLGSNSYQKDLLFNPIEFLQERLRGQESILWLDICCGEGRALIEAAMCFNDKNLSTNLQIIGIDLAGIFQKYPSMLNHLQFLEISVEDFQMSQDFDPITCVHGLHYIGDKLSVIQKAASWLKEDGMFLGNLDLRNLKLEGKQNSNRIFSTILRNQGFSFDSRRHLLTLKRKRNFTLPFEYLGADEQAGPNYTGQSVIDSYYKL